MKAVFDIGGTNMRVAISADDKILGDIVKIPTPARFADGMSVLINTLNELSSKIVHADRAFTHICGGIAGVIRNGSIIRSPNLPGWNSNDFSSILQARFPDTVIPIENDASFACLGEATEGAGAGADIVAYLTVSTGIGGGLVSNGTIVKGRYNPEPGHQIVDILSGTTLEAVASGSAHMRKYGRNLTELGDSEATRETAKYLAVGIHNTIVHWSPDVFILGGPVILKTDGLFEATVAELEKIVRIYPELPAIKKAALGDRGVLIGALRCLTNL